MILVERLTPAADEQCIKAYHCTSFRSKLLGIASEGYLEVTNKRVLFQASSGDSLIHTEVPIQDVSGVTVFKGSYFSFWHLVGALLLGLLVGGITGAITTLFGFAGIGQFLGWLFAVGLLVGGIVIDRRNIFRPVCAVASSAAFSALILTGGIGMLSGFGRSSDFGMGNALSGGAALLAALAAFAVGIYALICLVWYAIRKTMALAVGSKGGSQTPIVISGAGGGAVAYSSAARALEAEPAEDAEAVSRELGALIMDIQERGDLIAEKWQPAPAA